MVRGVEWAAVVSYGSGRQQDERKYGDVVKIRQIPHDAETTADMRTLHRKYAALAGHAPGEVTDSTPSHALSK